jgi:glycosyltransferase involved in cell wall biosynthesis
LGVKGRGHVYGFLAAYKGVKLKPDIIYGRSTTGCFFAAFGDTPVIFESHSPVVDSGNVSAWMFTSMLKKRSFERLVVISKSLEDYYLKTYHILKGKTLVAHDGADNISSGIEPIILPHRGERLQLGYLGNLYPGKGMEVISLLAERVGWADFHVVGGVQKDISYWKEKTKHSSNVFYHGFVPHADSPRFIAACDVVMLPNQARVTVSVSGPDIGQWTSPLKMFEYMASAKPIVASDIPVLREVLKHEYNALLCPPEDLDAWEAAIIRLRDNAQLRQRLAQQALYDFQNEYSWLKRAKVVLQV